MESNIYLSSSGSCITIKSNNVALLGQNHIIHGLGPYYSVPPFSYGIDVVDANNVTVSGLHVANFSYGIYLNASSNVNVSDNNASADVMSGIYLFNSYHNIVHNNQISFVPASQGALLINASFFNNVSDNLIKTNGNIGLLVNGTDNTFLNNTITNNPVDLKCSPSAGSSKSNRFESTYCSTNQYCNFAQCSLNNIPLNLSTVHLSLGVTTCGGIYAPGNYTLQNDLYATNYVNMSNPAAKSESCITILAPDVNLNCKGHIIANAGTGVTLGNIYDNVSNCNVENNTIGVYSYNQLDVGIHNTTISKGTYGLELINITSGNVSDVRINSQQYGVDINNSTGVTFLGLNATSNTYGVYVQYNPENIFKNSNLMGNSNQDLFCDVNSYISTSPVFQNNKCGATDCRWAASSCATLLPPPLAAVPISSCQSITSAGNYSMTQSILQSGTCIDIKASNVVFNCNNHYFNGAHSGSAILVSNATNVTLQSCNTDQYFNGISITNSSKVSVTSFSGNGDSQGIVVSNSRNVSIQHSNITNYTGAFGLELASTAFSSVKNVSVVGGADGASSFILNDSNNNTVMFDSSSRSNGYGFKIVSSQHNTILNDSAFNSPKSDYYCSGLGTGIYAQQGSGINYGINKQGCAWLVELNPIAPQQCYLIQQSATVILTGDLLYPYGSTCYTVAKSSIPNETTNSTVINCAGHTVFATKGGTFVDDMNQTGIKVENCFIKNFTTPIVVTGKNLELQGTIINNTIANTQTAINITDTFDFQVTGNLVLNATANALVLNDANYAKITKNTAGDANSCIYLKGGTGDSLTSNICNAYTYGISLVNNTQGEFQDNIANGASTGFYCGAISNSTQSFSHDFGGNVCSSTNCQWISSSSSTCPA